MARKVFRCSPLNSEKGKGSLSTAAAMEVLQQKIQTRLPSTEHLYPAVAACAATSADICVHFTSQERRLRGLARIAAQRPGGKFQRKAVTLAVAGISQLARASGAGSLWGISRSNLLEPRKL